MLVDHYPSDARSWSLYGDALNATGLTEDAMSAYSRALERNPHLISARLARAAILAGAGQVESAGKDVDFVRQQFPHDPRAAYLKAELLEASGQQEQALELYEEVAQLLSLAEAEMLANDTQLTVMVAVAHIKSGQLQQARKYLEGYQANNVDNVTTGKVLARLQLQQDDPAGALDVLGPLLSVAPDDQELLALKARSYTALESYKQSIAVWREFEGISGESVEASAQIAVNQILDGSTEQGIAGLEKVLLQDNGRVEERVILARSYLQRGNHEAAVRLAEELVEREPDRPEFRTLLGRAHMYTGNYKQARAVLDSAVASHPADFAARMSLAEVLTAQGELDEARAGLRGLLKEFPDRADVLLQQARVDRLSGDLGQARKYAEQSVLVDSESLDARTFLITVLLEGGNNREAELLAEQTAAKFHERAEAQLLLAQTLTGVGKPSEARTSLKIASRRAGSDHALLYQIARVQIEIGALPDARTSLLGAIVEKPDMPAYREAEIEVELRLQNYPKASELASALVTAFPDKTAPLVLYAAALSGQGLLEEALPQYALAQKLAPDDTSILISHYRTLVALGNSGEAERILTAWLQKAPDDPLVNYAFTELLMEQQRWDEAEEVLLRMNTLQPDNPLLLNNMAYVLQALNRPGALAAAMRAYDLAPQIPQINDTVGWILVGLGRPDEGLPYLREAVARQADSPVIRYHLAVALRDMGREREAARVLAIALQQPQPFLGREEAEKLLATMQ
jgi:putative PEP-CTERM system TPR-repeat lipoprotein